MKTVEEMRKDLKKYCKSKRRSGIKNCDCKYAHKDYCVWEALNGFFYGENEIDIIKDWHETLFPEQYQNDPVNHPAHYTSGKIEVADFIADQRLNFDRGNAVKYLCRAGMKDPACEIQDLEKAIWYINHEIKTLKERNNDRN